jgi:hypothetical protein
MLSDIADRSVKPLSNRGSLNATYANAAWDQLTMLPVVGRKQNLLGGLSRSALQKGLLEHNTGLQIGNPGSIVMQLLAAFGAVGAALGKLALQTESQISATNTKENPLGRKRTHRNQ